MARRSAPGIAALAAWLAAAPARAEPAPSKVTAIVVIAEGLDEVALREGLALRVPAARISGQVRQDMPCETGCAIAQVRREAAGLRIEVKLADGRVFTRAWTEGVAEPERAAATSLAHLIAAIEDGTAEPEVVTATVQPATVQPAPEQPPPEAPEPVAEPGRRPAPAPLPRFDIGPTAGLAAVFGIGSPAELAGWSASGGFVGGELRLRRGFVAGLELRSTTARDTGALRLNRVRFAAALGYSLRRGLFELRLLGSFTVEPWWVTIRADAPRRQFSAPLLGVAATVAPGLSATLRSGVRMHVGLRVEIAASALPGTSAVVRVRDPYGAALFRLGGAEMTAAAEIGVRWGSRR